MSRLLQSLKKHVLAARIRRLVALDWRRRHREVFRRNPSYREACRPEVEAEHIALWHPLSSRVRLETLRVCRAISGVARPEFVPEEIFVTEIEPRLNERRAAFLEDKSIYERWFETGIFPEVLLHNIDGDFYDPNLRFLPRHSVNTLIEALPFPVVLKPNVGSSGGRGVRFPATSKELLHDMVGASNYVVQRLIRQHESLGRFNRAGLNTLRVCTYRSVADGLVRVLNLSMRMGKGGSLDNETAGGLVCGVFADGRINDYAVDKYGTKYLEHPDSRIRFRDAGFVPDIDRLVELSTAAAASVLRARLTSLDASYDADGRWRLIEVNLFGQTIRFAQYAGKPFFGEFTEEVIDYCRHLPR